MGFIGWFRSAASVRQASEPTPNLLPPEQPTEPSADAPALARRTPPPIPQQPRSLSSEAGYQADLVFQNLVTLGQEYGPQTVLDYRRRARWGDPRFLYALYDEMVRLLIGVQVGKLRDALAGTRDTFTPPDEYKDEADNRPEAILAREIRDDVERQFGKHLPDLKRTAGADKFLYGIGPAEIRLQPGAGFEGRERVLALEGIPPRRCRMDRATQDWQLLPAGGGFAGVPVSDLSDAGVLALLELDAGKAPLDQRGLMFQCLVLWGVAQKAIRWWARSTELNSVPFRQASYPDGRSDLKPGLEEDMRNMGAAPWYVGPTGVDIKFLAPPSTGSTDKHQALLEYCTRGFDAIILGHQQATGVTGQAGSQNSSNDAQDASKDRVNALCAVLAHDVEGQIIRPYVLRNYGRWAAENLTPTYTAKVVEREDPITLTTVAEKLHNVGAGEIVDAEDLVVRAGLKVAKPGARTLASLLPSGLQPGALEAAPGDPFHIPLSARSGAGARLKPSGRKPEGREIVSPYRKLLSGAKSNSDLLAIAAKLERRPAAAVPVLTDQLAALLLDARLSGVAEVRKAREEADA